MSVRDIPRIGSCRGSSALSDIPYHQRQLSQILRQLDYQFEVSHFLRQLGMLEQLSHFLRQLKRPTPREVRC